MSILSMLTGLYNAAIDVVGTLQEINVTLQNSSSGGCGCGDGVPLGDIVDQESQDPPEFPDPSQQESRCKAATAYVRVYAYVLNDWANRDYDDLAAVGIAAAAEILASALVLAPIAIAGVTVSIGVVVVFGALVAIVALLFGSAAIDLADMVNVLETNEAEFVCALMNAGSADGARADFLDVAEGYGLTTIELQVLGLLLTYYDANKIVQGSSEFGASAISADCSGCNDNPCNGVDIGADYVMLPVVDAAITPINAGSAVHLSQNIWRISGAGANIGAALKPVLTSCGYNWDALGNTAEWGFRAILLTPPGGHNLGTQGATGTFTNTFQPFVKDVDYRVARAGSADVAAWAALGTPASTWRGQFPFFQFIKFTGGTAGAYTCDLALWVVVHRDAAI